MSVIAGAQARQQRPALSVQLAVEEAHRCLLCHDAPCSNACPAGTNPAKFIRQIRFYNLKGAARTVLRNNPLGGVCSYVCPTEDTCTGACLRVGLDRPIDIAGLQRFAVEYGRRHGVRAQERGAARTERVAVVGAGPAGLAAAARLSTYGYQVTLFEARPRAGGMLRYGVPPSRLPDTALDADLDEVLSLGVQLRHVAPVEAQDGAVRLLNEGFAAVFVAPGLWQPLRLGIPGIDLAGVTTAMEFLEGVRTAREKAVSLVQGKNVAIVGGGSVAMDAAHCARSLGAERVYALALESMKELPAKRSELEQARQDGVVIKPQCRLTRVVGDQGKVVGVEGVETEWIEPGRLVPQNARDVEGTGFSLRVGAVVQAIGQRPSEAAGRMVTAAARRGALLCADEGTQATSVRRVFAGGDVVRGPGTVVAAVGDGKRAADAMHRLLSDGKEVAK